MKNRSSYEDMKTMTLLLTTYNKMARDIFSVLQHRGFNDQRPAHGNVMEQLDYRDGQRLTELADGAGVTPQSIGQLVDELEELGYVERKPDPADRRAKLIKLTTKGRRAVKAATEAMDAIDVHLKRILGADGFASLRASLEAVLMARVSSPSGPKRRA